MILALLAAEIDHSSYSAFSTNTKKTPAPYGTSVCYGENGFMLNKRAKHSDI